MLFGSRLTGSPRPPNQKEQVDPKVAPIAPGTAGMSGQEHDPLLEEFFKLQQKYGRLQEKYDKHREEHDKLPEEYDKLRFASEQINARKHQTQTSIQKLATECGNAKARISNLQNEVHNLSRQCSQAHRAQCEEQELAATLHQQLLVFKKKASASARVAKQLTDDDIRSKMDTIFYSIQDFVMRALRRGPSASGDQTDVKDWLERTRKLLLQMDRKALQQSDKALESRAIEVLKKRLGRCIAVDWNASEASLRKAFTSATELFRVLHSSKATFYLEMTSVHDGVDMAVYDFDRMTSVNSAEEEAALIGRPIEVSVFPGIWKYGDELGQNADQMTVMCKARVISQ
ncbi:hypothetical protein KC356_g9233 [Hortaea werneckii]|nr:hypothetical protein KC356_g9233 [Hortaea werneckii]